MNRRLSLTLLLLVLLCISGTPGYAHVGSKDVFEELTAGPYKLFVTIRMPVVIPGVAQLEVRASGPPIQSIDVTPVPMVGEASKHPPTADPLKRSSDDANFYTGSLWLMASGSWKVQFQVNGAAGSATAAVPAPAAPLAMLPMQRPLGILLAALGAVLAAGVAGIVGAAVRESRLKPGTLPGRKQRARASLAGAAALAMVAVAIVAGGHWWNVEAADVAKGLYKPLKLIPNLTGDWLDLQMALPDGVDKRRAWSVSDFVPDHGKLMHLYAIREPEMDAAFHLHPVLVKPGELSLELPAMPTGEYKLYGDVVHASGFPETLQATLNVPAGLKGASLADDYASAAPAALSKGELGPSYKLPDGYTMLWDKPAEIKSGVPYAFRFHLLDPGRNPASGMQPYLGMAGHAAFVKTDGSVFAHTHPEGSAPMPAMALANGGMGFETAMQGMEQTVSPEVEFPYGFPSAGRYRIFVQMKHNGVVETGVFDAQVR